MERKFLGKFSFSSQLFADTYVYSFTLFFLHFLVYPLYMPRMFAQRDKCVFSQWAVGSAVALCVKGWKRKLQAASGKKHNFPFFGTKISSMLSKRAEADWMSKWVSEREWRKFCNFFFGRLAKCIRNRDVKISLDFFIHSPFSIFFVLPPPNLMYAKEINLEKVKLEDLTLLLQSNQSLITY